MHNKIRAKNIIRIKITMVTLGVMISEDLHRSRKTASNFDIKIRTIKAKYNKAGYPWCFIESVIRDFITPLDKDEEFIIPPNMFAEKKPFLLLEIPYFEQNEIASK